MATTVRDKTADVYVIYAQCLWEMRCVEKNPEH